MRNPYGSSSLRSCETTAIGHFYPAQKDRQLSQKRRTEWYIFSNSIPMAFTFLVKSVEYIWLYPYFRVPLCIHDNHGAVFGGSLHRFPTHSLTFL